MIDPELLEIDGVTLKRIISAEQIKDKVKSLAQTIENDYKQSKNPLFICILKGSFIFASDLLRSDNGLCEIEFVRLSSYEGTSSTGKVKTMLGMNYDKLRDRNVVIVEDIIDSGNTLALTKKMLQGRNPASLKLCTLLDKPARRETPVEVDYTGFTIPDAFVVGYGLDYAQKYRNLPYIGVVEFVEGD